MTTREVKELLRSYLPLKDKVERLKEKLEEINTDLDGMVTADYTKPIVKNSPQSYAREQALDIKNKIQQELDEAIILKYAKRREIEDFCARLSNVNRDYDIVIDRYLNNLSYKELSKKYFYDYDTLKSKLTKIYKKLIT